MKKTVLVVMLGILLIASNLFAANGDLIVEGNLGVGTNTPSANLDVVGSAVFEGSTDANLFNIDGVLGKVSITGGTSGVFRNNLFTVTGTDVKRAASYGVTKTFDYDENDSGIALAVSANRSGGINGLTGLTGVLAITHNSTTTGVSGGSAASFAFQIGAPSGSGTVDITSVSGFSYVLSRRYNIPSTLTYNVANSYGAIFGIQDGGTSWGGQVNVANQYGAYFSDYTSTGGTKRVNISNLYGLYVEPLSGATNNTLLALGGTATGNWSIYNASTYNNYFAGNVGIGTTNPGSYKLYVAGDVYATGSVTQYSDVIFKKNINSIDNALNKVMNLKGVTYEWKKEEYTDKGFAEGRHYGVVAQEVEKVLPEAVKEGPDGHKGVAYTEMIPVLIEAVKEQQKIIEELKAKVQKLEAKDFVAKAR